MSDASTLGADPDPDGDADPSENTPTPVTLAEAPSIAAAKAVAAGPIDNGDGSFSLSFQVLVENIGDVVLTDVAATEDLAATFPAPLTFTVEQVLSSDFAVNAGFDGVTDVELLAGTDTLAVGASGTVTIELLVWPNDAYGTYENTVHARGTSPAGVEVIDASTAGADLDPDGDGDPSTDNEPTPIDLPEFGTVMGRIWMDLDSDGEPDIDEEDVIGARVILTCGGSDSVVGTADDTVFETIISAGSPATYVFEEVPPGVCEVSVDPESLSAEIFQSVDPDTILDGNTVVEVAAGGVTEASFGYFTSLDLAITKLAVQSLMRPEVITWYLTVTNEGTETAKAPITVTDHLPASATLVSDSGENECAVVERDVICTRLADLAPGEEFTISLTTHLEWSGTVVNTATVTVSADQTDVDLSNNTDDASSSAGTLPFTGADMNDLLFAALFMMLTGAVLVVTNRREPTIHRSSRS